MLHRLKPCASLFASGWEARVNPPHQFDGIINRIAERVFSCGRWPTIQPHQSPHQKHSGYEIDQFLSAFVHRGDKISSSLYLRLAISDLVIFRQGTVREIPIAIAFGAKRHLFGFDFKCP